MRFQLDEDLPDRIAAMERAAGLDVISSQEAGRNGWTDEQQLRQAAADGRCLVTRNVKHFVLLTRIFLQNNWPHAGVLGVPPSIPNDDVAGLTAVLVAYADMVPGDLPPYLVDYLKR